MSGQAQVPQTGFLVTTLQRLRAPAQSALIDFGQYLIYWIGVLAGHYVKQLAAFSGVDPAVVSAISFMEKLAWIGTFGAFFWRILLRAAREVKKD